MSALSGFDRPFALAIAALGGFALSVQLFLFVQTQLTQGGTAAWALVLYFGYYTILTNLFCVIVALAIIQRPAAESRWNGWRQPWVISAAAVSILLVGVIFHLLLRHEYQPTGISAVTNVIHHYLIPAAFTFLWWRVVPRSALTFGDVPRIVAYPFAYLVYILFRGEVTGLYPYFFIDVSRIGYSAALINAGAISLLFILVSCLFVAGKR